MLRTIVKFTTAETVRRGNIDLNLLLLCNMPGGCMEKNHFVSFLLNKRYEIPLFFKIMPPNKFTKILKYLRFDDKPNTIKSGFAADKFAPIRDVFNTLLPYINSSTHAIFP